MTATRVRRLATRPSKAPGDAADAGSASHRDVVRTPTLGAVCAMVVVLVAALIGAQELHDNSFFTHLATGRLLIQEGLGELWGGMADPYTFTSGGRDWIVQSWLASVLYAAAEELAGAAGIRLLAAATCGALAGVAWRLTRPAGSLIPRVALTGAVLVVGATTWSPRPFLFGLLFFALTILAAEGGIDPRWLVPVGWLWVNTHGSFPLGVVALVLLAIGRRLDGEDPSTELRALRWSIAGIAAGGLVNPVGPWLLTFPVTMLARSDVLDDIVEWQSPDFAATWARVFLLLVLLGVVMLARRASYRAVLPFGVFLASALLASRNMNVAVLAFLPGVAAAMRGIGSIDGDERRPALRTAAAVLAVATPVLVVLSTIPGDFDLRGYPTAALDYVDERGWLEGGARIATHDYVGNLLELQHGRDAAAFIDDRFELHDRELVEDYHVLQSGLPDWGEVLDRRGIDVVLWERKSPLGSLLLASDDWRVVYDDTTAARPAHVDADEWERMVDTKPFLVACRTSSAACSEAS
ncbi:MAG TPA: hypothetical protein VF183_09245 [Acidimicrobiales bacterium]